MRVLAGDFSRESIQSGNVFFRVRRNPQSQSCCLPRGYRSPRLTVVGVIADVRRSGLSHPPEPELFVPYLQATAKDNETPSNKMFLFIKTASEPLGLADAVRRTVLSLDPE